ncbi:MAG: UDP-N-acetylmuramoyl-L-alanine--D-glutamate ligase [Rhodospirillaceae bacterium]|nr:UDP-N-acetylmuramoyl-L-alanine--D-glutamate ligase [Rhodospirillaceae bacterium]MBT3910037.1 UDP-N-acetylmuramoyl-L-alanine--D-glutamate ligase [Rhodospirillaceae bacterium]MBT6087774.1 UDP-N-acetylmuramoyl-L-alanine--D-glutamate ligase [Rhodospirillaceae bacterium]MBT6884334.1 UDP-N-acetylmuramoyl-L-alanine--D-glutamate ligase [Rhodospirillaceae bacterium]MBT7511262.1 UDP-N-acetylmuramoyl-L-alanine--D-glutamate ligase [Rhodospirillaceae bacterium]
MIDVFPFAGYPVAVFGLGRSGMATVKALMKSKAEVSAWDDDEASRNRAALEGVPLVDLYGIDWREMTTLVVSPGVPLTHPAPHPIVELARAANCEVIGDIELLARTQRWCNFIGITGTNGKSTTTALLGHIMQVSGREAEVGGNLGIPALTLEPLGPEGTYVLEMSSYQLDLTVSITFDVAVLLNISADHLDRHGGMDGYVAAKRQIFHRQTKPRAAVVGIDDEISRAVAEELKAEDAQVVIPVSGRERAHGGVYALDGVLFDDMEGTETPVCNLKQNPSLPGEHNGQNAAAAYAAAKTAGVAPHAIMACLQSYPGLVHRQEPVDIVDGVAYVNDSKATNAEAAARALASYENIYWIAGGRPKEGGLDACLPYIENIRHAYLIGEAAMAFGQSLDGKVPFEISGELTAAVTQAHERALADGHARPVVVLSPAAASFDQFDDFEARGNDFKDLVEGLPGEHIDPFEEPGIFPGTEQADVMGETGS